MSQQQKARESFNLHKPRLRALTARYMAIIEAEEPGAWAAYLEAGQPAEGPAADVWDAHLLRWGVFGYKLRAAISRARGSAENCDFGEPGEHCECDNCGRLMGERLDSKRQFPSEGRCILLGLKMHRKQRSRHG